ncbi:MAG: S9 family peptidase [Planctomycetes bacterium]|nr:S9 family peptidase [Planctomycetota bacterium]
MAAQTDQSTPLISRSVLFGNPDRANSQISHDGKQLAYLSAVNGVLNIWVTPIDDLSKAKAVTGDAKRGIRQYQWAYTNQHILYLQDSGGDENWRVYCVDLASNKVTDLTPLEGVAARIEEVSERSPDEILVALNDRDPQYHDVYRVNIRTGERKLVVKNDEWAGLIFDQDYAPRLAMKQTPDGGTEWYKFIAEGKTEKFDTITMQDALSTGYGGLDKAGETVYLSDSRNRDTAALFAVDAKTGGKTLLAEHAKADAGETIRDPKTGRVQAVDFCYGRGEWKVIDKAVAADLDYLKTVADGEFRVQSRAADDKTWIVTYIMDNGPARNFRYDRDPASGKAGKAAFLYTNTAALEGKPLARMHPIFIKSRDGFDLVSFLTLPPWTDAKATGRPSSPLPMVLLVHGGPWAADEWGYDRESQWLANRGYAVLQVNYRGSVGFGKKFLNAANREWAGKMHDDLVDAVNWAVEQKIAKRDKVAIMGGSYGGYATLVGLTFTPELFACGVDIVGPSNLNTLLSTIPPYWAPMIELMTSRVGDHRTDEGKKFLDSRSPLTFVNRICRPLLIGQGANDPRVKQSEADQIVRAMQEKKIPVTYVLFPDEGHGFARPENNMAFFCVAEAFLSQHLGGRYEPIADELKKSSAEVKTGADQIPGVADAVKSAGRKE